ncbi:Transitional endoplasmic reticulum ATPase-like protein 1 [Frankliniella fusca]|uniref:Transitional endoplasmic reticulum ATPase-like protein 1 n=1 Tax=Frankliniella fusca TaxID=407009 RepID=A0AAE1I3T7_9NEOP|nr:Transitional endoplasmic reticulum ATPase-like protein 1 [Frankliniella fusca]
MVPEGLASEVVYDSILLNKQKTKSYWEQLMMAAAAPGSPPAAPPPTASSPPQQQQAQQAQQVAAVVPQSRGGGDLPSLEQAGSEVSEQEYFDARSSVSPGELLDDDALAGEGAGPKVVETVAKACRRLERESVVERDIRLQREREEQLAREREAALDLLRDDGFVSIPTSTTDEGACSEYGSEEKEHSIDGSSR